MSSGALPKVAFSRPPTASPVRAASFSVELTISAAIGMIDSAAEKNMIVGATPPISSKNIAIGTKMKNQFIGLRKNELIGPCAWSVASIGPPFQ